LERRKKVVEMVEDREKITYTVSGTVPVVACLSGALRHSSAREGKEGGEESGGGGGELHFDGFQGIQCCTYVK